MIDLLLPSSGAVALDDEPSPAPASSAQSPEPSRSRTRSRSPRGKTSMKIGIKSKLFSSRQPSRSPSQERGDCSFRSGDRVRLTRIRDAKLEGMVGTVLRAADSGGSGADKKFCVDLGRQEGKVARIFCWQNSGVWRSTLIGWN